MPSERSNAGGALPWSWLRGLKWVTHPITVFVALQIVWLAITLIWVIWFVSEQEAISDLAQAFGGKYFDSRVTLTILVTGCVLLGVLLVGTIVLFVFGQRQNRQVRHQRIFVSSVTHELKSPLASLQLTLETMRAHQLDEATSKRMHQMAHSDINRLRRLVDQILVAGRLDRGGLTFGGEEEDVGVAALVRVVTEQLTYLDPRLAARLAVKCPADLQVHTSRSALLLILNNLIENAVKYSPPGAAISVRAAAERGGLALAVEDRGLGLTALERRRLFRMFHRGEDAVRKAIPGTGLGLYIVRSVVRLFGGKVWADSPGRGQGATFHVILPVRVTAPGHAPVHAVAGAGSNG
jgi:signal transduction histidine kinase